jgi:HK97 gp10 family phage protein
MRVGRISPDLAAALSQRREVAQQVRRVAAEVRDEARRLAPKDTGAGAKSIRVVRDFDRQSRAVTYRVSWDKTHFYMGFHEFGTSTQPARPFLRPAAEKVQRS